MSKDLHGLLKKQIKEHFKIYGTFNIPEEIDNFLSTINSTYLNFDKKTQDLEKTLTNKTDELEQTETDHRISVEDLELKIHERTLELEKLNRSLKNEIEERKRI